LWTFAQEPVFNDLRVALAVATRVDAKVRSTGSRIFYVESRGPQFTAYVSQPPAPDDQVPLLLAAAGFPGGLGDLQEVARCKIWSAPPVAGLSSAVPTSQAAAQIATLLQGALAELGIQTQPCLVTENPAEADLLVWVQGGPPPAIPSKQQSTFLALPGISAPSSSVVAPPPTGDAGLRAAADKTYKMSTAVEVGAIILLVLVGLWGSRSIA
jgi:hypothetical protein